MRGDVLLMSRPSPVYEKSGLAAGSGRLWLERPDMARPSVRKIHHSGTRHGLCRRPVDRTVADGDRVQPSSRWSPK